MRIDSRISLYGDSPTANEPDSNKLGPNIGKYLISDANFGSVVQTERITS